jgi:hypothetical protein
VDSRGPNPGNLVISSLGSASGTGEAVAGRAPPALSFTTSRNTGRSSDWAAQKVLQGVSGSGSRETPVPDETTSSAAGAEHVAYALVGAGLPKAVGLATAASDSRLRPAAPTVRRSNGTLLLGSGARFPERLHAMTSEASAPWLFDGGAAPERCVIEDAWIKHHVAAAPALSVTQLAALRRLLCPSMSSSRPTDRAGPCPSSWPAGS